MERRQRPDRRHRGEMRRSDGQRGSFAVDTLPLQSRPCAIVDHTVTSIQGAIASQRSASMKKKVVGLLGGAALCMIHWTPSAAAQIVIANSVECVDIPH